MFSKKEKRALEKIVNIVDIESRLNSLLDEVTSNLRHPQEIFDEYVRNKKDEIETERRKLEEEKKLLVKEKRYLEKEKELSKKAIKKICEEKSSGFPWLAGAFADFFYLLEIKRAEYFKKKTHPAVKAAEELREVAQKKREVSIKLRKAQGIIKFYRKLVPSLEEWEDEKDEELIKAVLSRDIEEPFFTLKAYWSTHQDPARRYLTKEEWNRLSRVEKWQLALDRYWNAHSRFEAGIMYERYIGYLYETKGWHVYYSGAREGKADLGRDLVTKNGNATKIIQCKRWTSKRFKIINENHIFQLFGTTYQYKIEHPEENIIGAFYTTAPVSDVAKNFAQDLSKVLKIEIYEKFPFKKYPVIKCNCSRRTNEKIYHLPFDQQYDTTLIEEERNECYVETIEEAEKLGYRRAFRWQGERE